MVPGPDIDRARTAIKRYDLSKPVRLLLGSGILSSERSFFDYGCGRGEDVSLLSKQGIDASGWDPHFKPMASRREADVVGLTYVINVIENPVERAEALKGAWKLARKVLAVSAQVTIADQNKHQRPFGDGVVTGSGTFQKYYTQDELQGYIEATLGAKAYPAALGTFLVFKDQTLGEEFSAERFHRKILAPRLRLDRDEYEKIRPKLEPLMAFFVERGRLPVEEEKEQFQDLVDTVGSIKRAFRIVREMDDTPWAGIIEQRRQDLLVYLSLERFSGTRGKFNSLSTRLQRDVKALFGSYQGALSKADEVLFQLGKDEVIAIECNRSPIGKRLPDALYVHVSCIDRLSPLLRLYEGLARRYVGQVVDATVLKMHSQKPQVTYLMYPDFDEDPHPKLIGGIKVNLRDLFVSFRDFSTWPNPPILHRKETFVAPDYPHYKRFATLTIQEVKHGLYEDASVIGTAEGWAKVLNDKGVVIANHEVRRAGPG